MTTLKCRKKPVVVEAIQWNGSNIEEIAEFVGENFHMSQGCLMIETLEGNHTALVNDYIIKGIVGEFYPCKPDIFIATYDFLND